MSKEASRHHARQAGADNPVARLSAQARTDWSNLLVPPAMLIVAISMGVAGHLHLGLAPEFAAAVGLSLFCLMLLCHVLLRVAEAAEHAAERAAERGNGQVASPLPPAMSPTSIFAEPPPIPPVAEGLRSAARAKPVPKVGAEAGQQIEQAAEIVASKDAAAEVAATLDAPTPVEMPAAPIASGIEGVARETVPAEVAAKGEPSAAPSAARIASVVKKKSPVDWTYRPVDLKLPTVEDRHKAEPSGMVPLGAMRPSITEHARVADGADNGAGGRSQSEVDRIDTILKRLATQIRAGAAAAPPTPEVPADAAALAPPAATAGEESAAARTAVGGSAEPATESDAALSSAVDALRSTVEAMRAGTRPSGAVPHATGVTVTPAETRLAAVAAAIAAERVDVFLEPILALAGEEARHFEVSVRLHAADGTPLDAKSDVGAAGGAGLLPLLDALGVRHAAGFALKLERRGRAGAVFSPIAGESLESDGFVGDVAARHAQGIADRLVLTFAQSEMRALGPGQLAALGDLGRLGFRFALQGVVDLDMDFEALRALGFEFVKLDAQVFMQGLICGVEPVPASDLCRHFSELGLAVIVSGITDHKLHQSLLGCGVSFGQGPLFGPPRPVPVAGAGIGGTIAA